MNQDFKKHVLECYPREACGVLVGEEYTPFENVSGNPTETFRLSAEDSLQVAQLGKTATLLHSHTAESYVGDPRTPSHEDTKGQQSTGIQWGIVHSDGTEVTDCLYFGKPSGVDLLGRPYVANVYDCFTLVRDYYFATYGVVMGTHPRPPNWEKWNPHYIGKTYATMGFSALQGDVKFDRLRLGDVLVFSLNSPYSNHLGVVVDITEEKVLFLHHLANRASREDKLSLWKSHLHRILRRDNNDTNTA